MLALKEVEPLLQDELLINITGQSGTGKTTFAMQYIGNMLSKERICLWFQAGEKFPKTRFLSLFTDDPGKRTVLNRILLIPGKHTVIDLGHQERLIQKITSSLLMNPEKIQTIVIDDISHHLRQQILRSEDIETTTELLDDFYSNQILPLIAFSHMHSIQLMLIHQSTYNPSKDKTEAFSSKLFSRISQTVWITLESNDFDGINTCKIQSEGINFEKKYLLDLHGIIFY